jgi:glycine betaine/choline ABC-type transport system substrate-binding protein
LLLEEELVSSSSSTIGVGTGIGEEELVIIQIYKSFYLKRKPSKKNKEQNVKE